MLVAFVSSASNADAIDEYTTITLHDPETLDFKADSIEINPSTRCVNLSGNVSVLAKSFAIYSNELTFTIGDDSISFSGTVYIPDIFATRINVPVEWSADSSIFTAKVRDLSLNGNVEICIGKLKATTQKAKIVLAQ